MRDERSPNSNHDPPQEKKKQQQQQQQGGTEEGSSAVRGASLLIVLQVASRAVTFIANQLLLRFLTAQLLGVSTQLEVYYLSVLFFARESLRVAIQRQGDGGSSGSAGAAKTHDSRHASQSVVNIAHLSLGLGLLAAAGLGAMYMHYVDPATAATTPYLGTALRIYGVAAVIELLSEPAFVVLQHRLRFGPRAVAESAATLLRCLTTFSVAAWARTAGLDLGVLPFATGQLAYGLGLLAVYLWYGLGLASAEGFSLLPRRRAGTSSTATTAVTAAPAGDHVLGYFYKPTLQLASSLTAQSLVKHVLTQGDTFLVSILSDPQSQGIYALANNYGGLLARLVFQPVEESSRNYFSKLLSTTSSGSSEKGNSDNDPPDSGNPTPHSITTARDNLRALLRFYILLSIIIISIGPFAAPLLIQIIAGARWSATGAGAVLARYCLYIPLLAINGVAEAFVSSVATKSQVHNQSLWMALFSLVFAGAGFLALRVMQLGAAGLVYANAVNMLCRIIWSARFIQRYFGARRVVFDWAHVLPNGAPLHVASTAVLWAVLHRLGIDAGGGVASPNVFKDLLIVAACAVPHVAVM